MRLSGVGAGLRALALIGTFALLFDVAHAVERSRRTTDDTRRSRAVPSQRLVESGAPASSRTDRAVAGKRLRQRRAATSPLRDLRQHTAYMRALAKRRDLGDRIVAAKRSPMFHKLTSSIVPITEAGASPVFLEPPAAPRTGFDSRELRRALRKLDAERAAGRAKTGLVESEGVPLIGADTWQGLMTDPLGLPRDTPVRIAILDLGFEGYQGLLGTEFDVDGTFDAAPFWDIEGCDGVNPCVPEGTAIAEVVADVAPDAELVLVAFDRGSGPDDLGSLSDAVDFLVSGGPGGGTAADIVVSGISWESGFFGDAFGVGPVADQIRRARDAGLTWVQDAGDSSFLRFLYYGGFPGEFGHWSGEFRDTFDHLFFFEPGNDGYMDVWLENEDVTSGPTYLNRFCLGPDDEMLFELVWDDWDDPDGNGLPAPTQDFSIDIYEDVMGSPVFLDTSEGFAFNEQSGLEGQFPWDSLNLVNLDVSQVCFFVSVFATDVDLSLSQRFHLYWSADESGGGAFSGGVTVDFDPIERQLPEGSRMIPADTPGTRVVSGSFIDDTLDSFAALGFPSEGESICAPDDVSTVALPATFLTTFGAAHAAGAVALVMDRVGSIDPDEAWEIFGARARDILGGGDTSCGAGRLCMLTDGCAP